MSGEGEGFLSRWSRRKRAVVEGRAPEEAAPPAPLEAKPETLPAEPEDDFDLTSLPPVESLTIESDFTAFLHRKVPLELRSAALRRAWSLDPAIRDFIGPADYAWDFNAPDGVPGFALELGGDAMKLLSHALGLDAPAPKPEEDKAPEAPAMAEAPAPDTTPEAPGLAIAEAAPEAEAAPATPVERPRRHGSALPV
ncbi:MAG: DUF3306 domain-containing protein [Roseomonas sp.]|nr:DUF3306 domain-containing protein [Roseomonas sp.]MCA3291290.1 DUF3306 domain-containing protein [Roseomonas sp.]MCA3295866.1 DUF3306 domain-containing protein [Roseomonas sp.]